MKLQTTQRNYYFDNIKSVLIFLVVIGHFIDEAYNQSPVFKSMFIWIYLFHMPLFIFITGFFSKRLVQNKERVLKRSFEFFTLYVLMKITLFIVRFLFDGRSTDFSLFEESSVPWYLLSVAIMYLISYTLRNVNKKAVFVLFLIIAVFAGYDSNIRDFMAISRTVVFYPFFLLGLAVSEENIAKLKSRKVNYIAAIIILCVSIAICYALPETVAAIRPLLTARNSYKSLNDAIEPFGPFLRLMVYALGTLIGSSVITIIPKKKLGYFTAIGTKTLPVYFFHRQILYILSGIGVYTFCLNIFGAFAGKGVWILIAVAVTVITSCGIFEKPLNYWSKILYKK